MSTGRREIKTALALVLSIQLLSVYGFAQGNQFKVRYNGGTVTSKVKADDWGRQWQRQGSQFTFATSVIKLRF